MILNMHHEHALLKRLFESEKGAGGIHCTSFPHQSQVQGNKNTGAVL